MRSASLLTLLLLTGAAARAQAPDTSIAWQRFLPAAVGDEWTYGIGSCQTSGWFCTPPITETRSFRIIGDTLIGGSRLPLYRQPNGRLCALGVPNGSTAVARYALGGHSVAEACPPIPQRTFTTNEPASPTLVVIGGTTYTFSADKRLHWGTGPFISTWYAADLGLYQYNEAGCSPNFCSEWRWVLTSARVGGVEYGGAVASEPEAEPSGAASLIVSPNPTDRPATVRLTLAHPSSVTLTVYDGLGRRVAVLHDGVLPTGTHTFALRSVTVAGSYLVRAVGPGVAVSHGFTVSR